MNGRLRCPAAATEISSPVFKYNAAIPPAIMGRANIACGWRPSDSTIRRARSLARNSWRPPKKQGRAGTGSPNRSRSARLHRRRPRPRRPFKHCAASRSSPRSPLPPGPAASIASPILGLIMAYPGLPPGERSSGVKTFRRQDLARRNDHGHEHASQTRARRGSLNHSPAGADRGPDQPQPQREPAAAGQGHCLAGPDSHIARGTARGNRRLIGTGKPANAVTPPSFGRSPPTTTFGSSGPGAPSSK